MSAADGSAKFTAIIAESKNAVVFDGRDGGHLHLEIPETDVLDFAPMIAARHKVLDVNIQWEVEDECA